MQPPAVGTLACSVSLVGVVFALAGCQPSRASTSNPVFTPVIPVPVRSVRPTVDAEETDRPAGPIVVRKRRPRDYRVVHVFVALCDNDNQGIVPVPARIGNGQDPEHNLYWGASFGVKTFFQKSPKWSEVVADPPERQGILRRAAFKSKKIAPPVYMIADAYDGAVMKDALADFLGAAAGDNETDLDVDGERLQAGGLSDLVAFVGHNGLMDMDLASVSPNERPAIGGDQPSGAVVLACMSHKYFALPLAAALCTPLITTSSLMAPEAYSLDAIVRSWAAGDDPRVMRNKAGDAYAQYQRIGIGAGRGVFIARPSVPPLPRGRRREAPSPLP